MKILRRRRPERFTLVANDALEDSRLSFRARGVLAYLMSRPDGWETDSVRLADNAREGRDAVRGALRELEDAGYLRRERVQDTVTGRWSTRCVFVDQLDDDPGDQLPLPTDDGFSGVGDVEAGKPTPGKPTPESQALLVSTESKNTTTPAREPHDQVVVEILAEQRLAALVNDLRARRNRHAVGKRRTGCWTPAAVGKAIRAAVNAGRDPAAIPAALRAIADDPATELPGRLNVDGAWWDAHDLEQRRARGDELATARRAQEQRDLAAAAAAAAARADRIAAATAVLNAQPDGGIALRAAARGLLVTELRTPAALVRDHLVEDRAAQLLTEEAQVAGL